jgi:hypothetical protein
LIVAKTFYNHGGELEEVKLAQGLGNREILAYICDSTIWQARESCVEEQKPSFRVRQRFNSLVSLPVRTLKAVNALLRSTVSNLTLMRR